jgi:hypothetical protein
VNASAPPRGKGSVEIEAGHPADLAVLDHEGTGRTGDHAEAAALADLPGGVVPVTSTAPTHDLRGRYDRDAVLRVRLTEHAGDGQSVCRC